jgi:hypothetical protein
MTTQIKPLDVTEEGDYQSVSTAATYHYNGDGVWTELFGPSDPDQDLVEFSAHDFVDSTRLVRIK